MTGTDPRSPEVLRSIEDLDRRWLLPGGARTSTRNRLVDVVCFLVAVAFGLLAATSLSGASIPSWLVIADQVAGGLGCLVLWWRRRFPVALALCLLVPATFSLLVQGAVAIALFTVAVHRPFRTAAAVGFLALLTVPVYTAIRPDQDLSFLTSALFSVAGYTAVLGWGMLVRSRRELLIQLTERARRAEEEAERRSSEIRRAERERIARDIHDVLAHRLSLLSVYAGALEYRTDSASEEVRQAAGVIRERSHEALQDVREVIGVLRVPDGDEPPDGAGRRPPPTFTDLDRLVAESRRAGTAVTVRDELASGRAVPDALGRAVYRIVQESLTNARKHAPGAAVDLALSGTPGDALTVVLTNPSGPGAAPGGGHGLLGLRERAELAGGHLEYGPVGDRFEVRARLPWPA